MKLPIFDTRKHFYSQTETARLYQMVGLYQIRQDSQLRWTDLAKALADLGQFIIDW